MTSKRILGLVSAVAIGVSLAACGSDSGGDSNAGGGGGGSDNASNADWGNCKVTSKRGSIKLDVVTPGTLTVETTLPAQGWWNGTTAESIKDGFEYCMAAEIANMGGLDSVTVKNVSFAQLVAGRTNKYDIALAESSITPERAKVVDFSTPYYDSNIGVLTKKGSGITADNITSKKCAAYNGTTSVPFLKEKLKCATTRIYPNSQTLYQGVLSGQVDAAFLDTAIVLAEAKNTGGKLEVPGQYETGEHYGAIFPKGSKNEDSFNKAIKTLDKDGTLKELSKTYLGPAFGGDPAAVPVWKVK